MHGWGSTRGLAWLGSLALLGCATTVVEGGAEPAVTASEGSRLTPLAWVPEDGTTVVAAGQFFDAVFNHPCAMSADEAGTRRCFPFQTFPALPRALFTTDECDERAIPAGACAERPAFVRELLSGTTRRSSREATGRPRARSMPTDASLPAPIARASLPSAFPTNKRPRSCSRRRAVRGCGAHPDAELAAVESAEVRPLGGGLEEREERLEDGSRTRVRAPETPCHVYATTDAGLRCLPTGRAVAPPSYTDPACTEPAFASSEADLRGALVLWAMARGPWPRFAR